MHFFVSEKVDILSICMSKERKKNRNKRDEEIKTRETHKKREEYRNTIENKIEITRTHWEKERKMENNDLDLIPNGVFVKQFRWFWGQKWLNITSEHVLCKSLKTL